MKEVIFKLPDDVLSLIIHKVENTPQEASLLEKWIYDGEERKTGKWIKDIYGNVVCSECRANRRDNRIGHIAFCNSCGSKMEVEE